ncbi:hypothetical protein BLNAU_17557 [Blattamonas nauphoetae]|uniref:Uncharacterized protein n=1 Tax=Blattamonas nauphoetae TaxID=2049346 RepID=A0ABQ9X6S0_9EUKA|nr:hypothetical protein BLNAU_18312 [Blattamonas nauphoetae]KAK2947283.1 hypothetical protein BLNAU_17759 [Blattamonas nauphoetae]KAK2947537.1 hypothetical protein BLNAU_17557 [Blattamonas nauphoetae]
MHCLLNLVFVQSTMLCQAWTQTPPGLFQHIMGLVLPYLTVVSNIEGSHALHYLLSSFTFQATLPVAEQLISMSPAEELDEHGPPIFPMLTKIATQPHLAQL